MLPPSLVALLNRQGLAGPPTEKPGRVEGEQGWGIGCGSPSVLAGWTPRHTQLRPPSRVGILESGVGCLGKMPQEDVSGRHCCPAIRGAVAEEPPEEASRRPPAPLA
ncbi:MAG TPA: hypothetical protein DDY91_18490 [Planctomycetaceae bacterium]|nr:hypothetical protein [Planctomycetaceae bacterium]